MLTTLRSSAVFGARMAIALVRRPALIPTAVRQLFSLAPTGWWRRPPFLPMPHGEYVEFRQVTLTGESGGLPEVHDVVTWLEWCRSMRSLPARR